LSSQQITIDDIEITLRKSSRARNLTITIKPFDGVVISIPERISFRAGEKLAKEKIVWIREHLNKTKSASEHHQTIDENSQVATRSHRLVLSQWENDYISVRLSCGKINVKYPIGRNVCSFLVQKAIRKGIEKAYREEAKEFLPKRLNDLSDRFNLPYKEVYIKNIKSRWGSCSGKDNINLSIHLMRLPDHLIDYVLLHELAHTKVRNHSREFWRFLDSLVLDSKIFDKELKQYKIY
jgi:predicted metal-dependent hydrolase